MEPAIGDLTRELERAFEHVLAPSPHVPELEPELEVIDNLMLDPWFFRTEEEIAAIADDPTARVVEIQLSDYSAKLCDPRWA